MGVTDGERSGGDRQERGKCDDCRMAGVGLSSVGVNDGPSSTQHDSMEVN